MTDVPFYINTGTPLIWKATGGDFAFTPASVANGAGRLGAVGDLGAFPRAAWYRWYAETQCQATPTALRYVDLYLAWWNDPTGPAEPDGGVGASDAAFATANDLRNLKWLGNIVVDAAAGNTVFQASGLVYLPVRHVSPVWWNATGAALTADDAEHVFKLTPVYDLAQTA